MSYVPRLWCRAFDAAATLALVALVAIAGCGSAPRPSSLTPIVRALPAEAPDVKGALPEVTVTLGATTPGAAEARGHAWYVTAVRDPVRGNFTAAVERRSVNPLWFDAPNEDDQRAAIVVVLRDGRPADLLLSVEHGQFVCQSKQRANACALRVSVDGAPPASVWFAVPRHWARTHLHLLGGQDAARLLAAMPKARQLRVQPTFDQEGSPEIEFAVAGLDRAIDRLTKHSVAAPRKLVAAN